MAPTNPPTPNLPPPGPWVTRWLSRARFGAYLGAAGGDQVLALRLYEWNADISSAILHDLAHVEVGLRNAYNSALEQHAPFQQHWTRCGPQLFAPVYRTKKRYDRAAGRRVNIRVDINKKPRESLDRALTEAGGPKAAPGKVIAQLMFGFWRYLSSAAHEVPLWRPYLHHAFPIGTARSDVDTRVGDLHELRNRVAHHEPLLAEDLPGKHQTLVELADLIDTSLGQYVRGASRVPALIAARPTR
jgi:hypothetical protein